ncbi:MAG: thioredoxin family protein, partial [Planctomycetota bacterium]
MSAQDDDRPRVVWRSLDDAFVEARRDGKPMLVMFRCVPCTDAESFYEQIVRPDEELARSLQRYVCVRVRDMRGVNLNLFQFDYDLTFAAFLMHPDGTIYHRYSGRSPDNAESHLNVASFVRLLDVTARQHQSRLIDPDATAPRIGLFRPEDMPAGRRYARERPLSCIHCHQINEFKREAAQANGTWLRDRVYMWPLPERLGLILESTTQAMRAGVTEPA